MNDQQRAAMQMALEALQVLLTCKHGEFCDHYRDAENQSKKAITALREALAQPQCEWVDLTDDEIKEVCVGRIYSRWIPLAQTFIAKFKEKNTPPVVPQGEPVGYWNGKETAWFEHELCGHPAPDDCTIPLYTAPPSVEAAIEDKGDYMEGYEEGWKYGALDMKEKAARLAYRVCVENRNEIIGDKVHEAIKDMR